MSSQSFSEDAVLILRSILSINDDGVNVISFGSGVGTSTLCVDWSDGSVGCEAIVGVVVTGAAIVGATIGGDTAGTEVAGVVAVLLESASPASVLEEQPDTQQANKAQKICFVFMIVEVGKSVASHFSLAASQMFSRSILTQARLTNSVFQKDLLLSFPARNIRPSHSSKARGERIYTSGVRLRAS